MHRQVDFTRQGGLYVYQDTLLFLQLAYTEIFEAMAAGMGDKYVLSGCNEVGGFVDEGMIFIGGQFFPFVGGAQLAHITTETIVQQEQYDDNTLKDCYYVRRAKMVALADANSFPYAELKRLPLQNSSVYDSMDKYHQVLKSMVNFESETILNGMLVTNIDTGASTCDISAGLVMFNGQLKATPAYSGTYPAYLNEGALWQTVVPGAGLYITFDPHTSQRYVDVLARAMTRAGKIEMYETLTDRFLPDGTGRWEMKGYELCEGLQNRVAVGLWWDAVATANVSDANNTVPGNTEGERKHTLSVNEQGALVIEPFIDDGDDGSGGRRSIQKFKVNGVEINSATFTDAYGAPITVQLNGAATSHNNMQPSKVVVYVKRSA